MKVRAICLIARLVLINIVAFIQLTAETYFNNSMLLNLKKLWLSNVSNSIPCTGKVKEKRAKIIYRGQCYSSQLPGRP